MHSHPKITKSPWTRCAGYAYILILKAQVPPILLSAVSPPSPSNMSLLGEEERWAGGTCQSTSPPLSRPYKGAAVWLAKGSLSPALPGAKLSTAGSQASEPGRPCVVPVAWNKVS